MNKKHRQATGQFLQQRFMAWTAQIGAVGVGQKNHARGLEHIEGIADLLQGTVNIREGEGGKKPNRLG